MLHRMSSLRKYIPASLYQITPFLVVGLFLVSGFCIPFSAAAQEVWNSTDWTSYDTITIESDNVDDDLTDFPVYVDLADLSATFWSTTPAASNTVGTDIRVTTNAGSPVELPRELVFASSTLQTGELHFKADSISSTTDTTFRIYYNGTTTGDYATDAAYGAENVWSNGYEIVVHFQQDPSGGAGAVLDSTRYGHHGTAWGSMTTGDLVSGGMGNGYDLDGSDDQVEFVDIDYASAPMTYSVWGRITPTSSGAIRIIDKSDDELNQSTGVLFIDDHIEYSIDAYNSFVDATVPTYGDDVWHYYTGTTDSSVFYVYFDAVEQATTSHDNTWSETAAPWTIGSRNDGAEYWGGFVDEFRLASSTRSAAWIDAEHLNQSTTTDFYTANLITVWNDSDWTQFDAIVIDADNIDDDLTDFPVYVDLSDLSATFWSTTPAASSIVGTDIRITNASNQELPRELVFASSTAQTGELHFKADTISSTTDTIFRIWYNGSTAGDYATTSTYGAQNVWSNNYVSVYHLHEDGNTTSGGYQDSTSNGFHGSGVSMTTDSDTTGKLGSAQDFDGSADYITIADNVLNRPGTNSFTTSAWVKPPDANQAGFFLSKRDNGGNFSQWSTGICTPTAGGGIGTSKKYCYFLVEDGSNRTGVYTNTDVANGTWRHTTLVRNGSDEAIMYVDGATDAITEPLDVGANPYDINSTAPWRIGNGNGAAVYTGEVDEVRIASTSRSAAWVSAEYLNQATTTDFYALASNEPTITSAANQTFTTVDGATAISPITIIDAADTAEITAANDIRIAIATSSVDMRFDTSDTAATISGGASGKVSGTVSYEGGGSVLVIDVTSDFAVTDSITISDLSYESFATANAATSALALHIDGGVDVSPVATDDKTVTINAGVSGGAAVWNDTDWTSYDNITIDADTIDSELTDFPVYVDLSDLSASFWSTTPAGSLAGADIRVTDANNVELPRELVFASSTAQTGELHFKAPTISSTVDTSFRIWYNGTTTTDYATTSTYGAQNVWSNGFVAVYHLHEDANNIAGGYLDSTSNLNHATGSSMSITSATGALPGQAQEFDGSVDYILAPAPITSDNSVTFTAWVNPQTYASYEGIIMSRDDALAGMALSGADADQLAYGWDASSGEWSYNDASLTFTTNEWNYAAVAVAPASTTLVVNENISTHTDTATARTISNWYIGRDPLASSRSWDGEIDEMRIASTTRNTSWLSAEYSNQSDTTSFYTVNQLVSINSADNQVFTIGDAATAISPITIVASPGTSTLSVTAANDIRIAIATSTVAMTFDTTDTTATISGGASGKVSGTVSYEDSGTTLVLDVTSDFVSGDTITITNLSFTNFTAVNTATTSLEIHTDGDVDASPADTDDKTVTIQSSWNNTDYTLYDTITIDADIIDETLTDFPVYVDLADLTDTFWATTPSGALAGTDIRVTTLDGTELPRELVFASSSLQTGELHFKAPTISSTVDTSFRIWYNGTTTGDYDRTSTYGAENVWSNGYALVMHFSEDANTNTDGIIDSTSNRNHGTAIAMDSTNNVSGQLGGAFDFDGSAEYLDFRQNNLPFGTASRTISAWITPDTFSGADQPLGYGGATAFNDAEFFRRSSNDWYYGSYNVNEHAIALDLAFVGVSTYIVGMDGPNQVANLYVDGIFRDSEVGTRSISEGTARIGSGPYNSGETWDGQIDEVRIASSTRSAAWVKAEHENQKSGQIFYSITNNDLILSAENQTFAVGAATTTISPITISETSSPTITAANDIRIAIGSGVAMTFDTTDTTATISGGASGKVSGTVSYEDSGTTLVLDVTSDFVSGDTITITNLSFTNFTAVNTATTSLEIHTDGDVDASPADTDDKTVTIQSSWNNTDYTLYDTITIDADIIDETLTDFPVYVDLADLTDTFWATTPSGALAGTDIRVTTLDGTELPRELVFASSSLQTGELHFKAPTISSTVDTSFRIWYNGTTTGDYDRTSTYGAENVWSNGYALVMHFSEDANTNTDGIIDSTSNRNHGTAIAMDSTNNVSGQLGGAFDFDGSAEYLDFRQNNLPFGTASRTISAWITPDTFSGADQPLGYGGATAFNDAEFFRRSSNDWYYGSYNVNEHAIALDLAFVGVSTYIVGMDGPNQVANLYVDGIFRDSEVGTRSISEGTARIGSGPYNSGETWDGQIDEVRIASSTRSAAWIAAEYLNQSTTTDFYSIPTTSVPLISSAANQTFDYSDSNIAISEIAVTDSVINAQITAANDIRIAIATSSVNMRWNTADTNAVIGGNVGAKVSGTVTYEGDGSVLVLDVTSDFAEGDQLSLTGLSFTNFLSANTATSALELHIDGGVDDTPVAIDDKTVTIEAGGAYAWSPTDWTLFDTITIDAANIDDDLTDFPVYVDLADLSATFWATTPAGASVVGTDIRVTDNSNQELPRELVIASSTAQTGELWFKAGSISSTTDTVFKIWYNGTTTGDYASTTQTGSQNVWTNDYMLVYHLNQDPSSEAIVDSTANTRNGTIVGTASSDELVTGKLGSALSFDSEAFIDFTNISLPDSEEFTLDLWTLDDDHANADAYFGFGSDDYFGANTSGSYTYVLSGVSSASLGQQPTQGLWHKLSITRRGTDDLRSSVNGGATEAVVTGFDGIAFTLYGIGSADNAVIDTGMNGDLDEVRIASTSRSDAWLKAEYFNQNGDGEFYTANPTAADNTQVWNDTDWTLYDTITIDAANIDDDLTDFPVYVDLADLSSTFWSTTVDGGTDIRITNSSDSELPREVVSASTTLETGELWFKADTISSTTDTVFKIWYNGTTTNDYARADTYGMENVWTNEYLLVYHMDDDPSGTPEQIIDSTSYRRDGNMVGTTSANDVVSGQLGEALSFDAESYIDFVDFVIPTDSEFTFDVWFLDDDNATSDTIYGFVNYIGANSSGNYMYYWPCCGNRTTIQQPAEGLWHKLSYTRRGTSNHYWSRNGEPATTDLSENSSYTLESFASRVDGGGSPDGGLTGDLDELRIASTSRSDAWLKAEYLSQGGSTTAFYSVQSVDPIISSAANQTFTFSDASAAISPITIYDAADTAEITAANDIRIAIDTSLADMRWDTTDTTATLSGSAAGKVSGTVSYEDSGATLVLNVTSDFATSESLTIADLSFTSFSASNTATSALSLHIDGDVDGTPAATDDKTITINASAIAWNDTSWTLYDTVTIDAANIDDDLTDFPVYVDLADLSDTFWAITPSASNTVGTDIRVTNASDTELPRELVFASSTLQTGELHFKADTISSTTDTVFKIWYNGDEIGDYASTSQYGAQNVWSNGFAGVWHLDDDPSGSSPQAKDSAGVGSDGITNGTMTADDVVSGKLGSAYDFDGDNDYINIEPSVLDTTGNTVSGWFYIDTLGRGLFESSSDNSVQNGLPYYYIQTNGSTLRDYQPGSSPQYESLATVATGQWYHITTVRTATSELAYVNGVEVLDRTITTSGNNVEFHIGVGFSGYFDGQMDFVKVSTSTRSAAWVKAEYYNQSTSSDFYTASLPPQPGTTTISNSDAGQVENIFSFSNKNDEVAYRFKLASVGENATVTELVLDITDYRALETTNMTDWQLHIDENNDGLLDGGDTQIGGAGSFSLATTTGTVTFAGDFAVSTSTSNNYIVVADTNTVERGDHMILELLTSGISTLGETSGASLTVEGSADSILHKRSLGAGSGGGGGFTEEGAPGDGVQGGGDVAPGEELGGAPNFEFPGGTGAPHNQWAGGANAYVSDATYASVSTVGGLQSYSDFNFVIPDGNTISGVQVKLEASAEVGTGTIEVALSADQGASTTTVKATTELTATDTIYELGSAGDLWGDTWSKSDFSNTNFRVRLRALPSSGGTVRVDAMSVRVFHEIGGGGSGGGSGEI